MLIVGNRDLNIPREIFLGYSIQFCTGWGNLVHSLRLIVEVVVSTSKVRL